MYGLFAVCRATVDVEAFLRGAKRFEQSLDFRVSLFSAVSLAGTLFGGAEFLEQRLHINIIVLFVHLWISP